MNKILISTVLAFCLLSSIGFSAQFDLTYNSENITLNFGNTSGNMRSGLENNISHFFLTTENGTHTNVLVFNLAGAYTGELHTISTIVNPYGFGKNSTHYAISQGTPTRNVSILDDGSWAQVQYFNYAANQGEGGIAWSNNSWYLAYVGNVFIFSAGGSLLSNFSLLPSCNWVQAIDPIDDKLYIYCSLSNVTIFRFNNNGTFDNYFYDINENEDPNCQSNTAIGAGFMTLMSSGLNQKLYVSCNLTTQHNLLGYDIDYANTTSNYTSTPANLTQNVIDIERQLLGIRNQDDALMLYSIGIASFFGLLAVIMVRKQPIILFTITFMLGLITFSYIGWLPTVFLFMMILISGIILAWKLSSIFIGDA